MRCCRPFISAEFTFPVIRKMRNIHDLRDDRGQAGAVKTDVNVTGQVCFMVVGVEVHTKQDRPDI